MWLLFSSSFMALPIDVIDRRGLNNEMRCSVVLVMHLILVLVKMSIYFSFSFN